MTMPAYSIASILQTNSYGTLGTDIFVGFEPDQPDDSIFVHNGPGAMPQLYTGTTAIPVVHKRPSVQIRLRGLAVNYNATYAKVRAITDLLTGHKFVDGSSSFSILPQSDIGDLGRDSKGRCLFSVNFQLQET